MNKDVVKKILLSIFIVSALASIAHLFNMVSENKKIEEDNNVSENILNNTDFILGLKNLPQLEYAVGDIVINIHEDDDFYKTFKENDKYEIFIDKKSSEINSMHYTSDVEAVSELDMKYLKNVYNLTFSSISSYMFEKTTQTIETMSSPDYIDNKNASIVKNGSVSESIIIGKTSEIKITMYYDYNGSRNEASAIDIAILKGNKW